MWCSPRLESAGGVAELPIHGGAEAALLSFNARRRRRLGFAGASVGLGSEACARPIKGRSEIWACMPGAGAEIMVVTLAGGGGGSRATVPRDIG
jgi:hypothetical protein